MNIEKKRSDVNGLPVGWKREEISRKSGLSAGRTDVYYFSPCGKKIRSKPELARQLGHGFDLSCFDFRSGKILQSAIRKSKKLKGGSDYGKTGIRHDSAISLPIRQTASIFKQPVTKVINQPDSRSRQDLKHGQQEQPKQVFWEKRLGNLRACNPQNEQFHPIELPSNVQAAGPGLSTENILQSVAACLHMNVQPITGQTANKVALQKNPGACTDASQPLIQQVVVSELDVKRQELRVLEARKKLEHAMTQFQAGPKTQMVTTGPE